MGEKIPGSLCKVYCQDNKAKKGQAACLDFIQNPAKLMASLAKFKLPSRAFIN